MGIMEETVQPAPDAAHRAGRLEVICGCMFSGKTEQLIGRLLAARHDGRLVQAFKHTIDERYSRRNLASHSGQHFPAEPVTAAAEVLQQVGRANVVAIDDAQFFDESLIVVCRHLRDRGCRVITAGLDRDCWSKPFGPIPELADTADEVIHTQAVCAACGQPATYTHRHAPIERGGSMVGGPEAYEPRCTQCFKPPTVLEQLASRRSGQKQP